MLFFTQYLKNLREIGSITPSSRFLVNNMLNRIDFEHTNTIVELGAGTGCFTKELLNRMKDDATLHSFEINKSFCEVLHTFSDKRLHVINDSAEYISKYVASADVIVSGMPLASLPKEVTEKFLNDVTRVLKPEGSYLQYQYSPLSRKKTCQLFRER